MKKPEPPCTRTCDRRAAGCGATCEAWKAYEKARDEFYIERQKEKEGYQLARDQAIKRHIRRMKEGFD